MPRYRKRSYRKRARGKRALYRRMKRSRFAAKVTKVLMKKIETKYFDIGTQEAQLFHNLGYGVVAPVSVSALPDFFNPWLNITQGTARSQRIGDCIVPRGMALKLFWQNKTDRPCTMLRVIVAILPKMYNGNVVTSVFDPFQIPNLNAMGNTMCLPIDHDKGIKCLYDRVHRMNTLWPNVTGNNRQFTKLIRIWIKRKRGSKIKYDTYGNTIVNKPIAVYCIPYEEYATLTTDKVSSITGTMRLYYKDP